MIRIRQGNTVILGLDAENVRRLQDDKPIHVRGKPLHLPVDIFIVYGDELKDVAASLGIQLPDGYDQQAGG